MKRYMDTVTFESRLEVDEIYVALDTYAEEHKEAPESVKRLRDMLNVLYIEW